MSGFDKYMNSPKGWATLAGILFMILLTNGCHEAGHALGAWWGGDKRASIRRRATLNPMKHIHWLLTIVMPLGMLYFTAGQYFMGGAKPVMINMGALSRRGMAFAAVAGPLANFLFAGLLLLIVGLCMELDLLGLGGPDLVRSYSWPILVYGGIWFSIFLGFLNLIPFPGLDGGHILACFLPDRARMIWYRLTPLGILALIGLFLYVGGLTYKWGITGPPPQPSVFAQLMAKVENYVYVVRDYWRSVL